MTLALQSTIPHHPHGLLLINKQRGISSTTLVNALKRLLPRGTRIGHAGTLDPFAEGLLIVCIGRSATRSIPQIQAAPKTYIATGQLDCATTTLDPVGPIMWNHPEILPGERVPRYTERAINNAVASIPRAPAYYLQSPALYSACKHEGKPLYAIARGHRMNKEDLEALRQTKSTPRIIYELALTSYHYPFISCKTVCSSGTYIRVLLDDIGQALGTRITTVALTRTAIGNYLLENASPIAAFKSAGDIYSALIPAPSLE